MIQYKNNAVELDIFCTHEFLKHYNRNGIKRCYHKAPFLSNTFWGDGAFPDNYPSYYSDRFLCDEIYQKKDDDFSYEVKQCLLDEMVQEVLYHC